MTGQDGSRIQEKRTPQPPPHNLIAVFSQNNAVNRSNRHPPPPFPPCPFSSYNQRKQVLEGKLATKNTFPAAGRLRLSCFHLVLNEGTQPPANENGDARIVPPTLFPLIRFFPVVELSVVNFTLRVPSESTCQFNTSCPE